MRRRRPETRDAMDAQVPTRGKPLLSPGSGRPVRILVVDDEYLIAQDLAEAIHEAGCEVVGPAGGLSDALRLLGEGRTDAAMIDLNLGTGGEGGFLLAEKLAARLCPFIAFSGDETACARFRGRFPGAMLMEKPAPRHRIQHAIAALSEGLPD